METNKNWSLYLYLKCSLYFTYTFIKIKKVIKMY